MKELVRDIKIIKEKRHLCRFFVSVDNVEEYTDGFILDISKTFILIRECGDFEPKGLKVFEISKISKIRYGSYEISFTKIVKAERLFDRIYQFDKIPLDNYFNILNELKKRHKYVITQSACDGDLNFCIGEIIKVNKASVSILYFDATGKLDKTPSKIVYTKVLDIEFDSNYINIFKKYLKK